jgi:hypothetical protein
MKIAFSTLMLGLVTLAVALPAPVPAEAEAEKRDPQNETNGPVFTPCPRAQCGGGYIKKA